MQRTQGIGVSPHHQVADRHDRQVQIEDPLGAIRGDLGDPVAGGVQHVAQLREAHHVDVLHRVGIGLIQRCLALVVEPGEEPPPARAQGGDVGRGHDQPAVVAGHPVTFPDEVKRPLDVLDPVDAHHRIQLAVLERQPGVHVGAMEVRARHLEDVLAVRRMHLPALLQHLLAERAFAAGDVQDLVAVAVRHQPDDGLVSAPSCVLADRGLGTGHDDCGRVSFWEASEGERG